MKGSIIRRLRFVCAVAWIASAAGLALGQATGRQSFTLTPDGEWQQLETPTPPAPDTPQDDGSTLRDPQLSAIAELVRRGDFDRSKREALRWLLDHPGHPLYDRGLYLMAASLRGTREYIKGFYYCDQLLDEHPESPLYQDALQLQYEIADAYLRGAKDRFVGLRILGRQDEAVEMLFRIQTRAPGSAVAENALLRTGDYYYATEQFELAADAYQSFARAYPRNPVVPEVLLREAYSNIRQFRAANFDSTALINGRELFRKFKAEYPEIAGQRNVDEQLLYIDRQLARKLVDTADFYRRTGKPASAARVCRKVIATYPNLPETADAQQLLSRLEGK